MKMNTYYRRKMHSLRTHCLITLLNVVLSISSIRTEAYPDDQSVDVMEGGQVYKNDQEPENYEDVVQNEEKGNNEEVTELKELTVARLSSQATGKKSKTPIQVNLDQLVEKVRERLLGGVKSRSNQQLKQKVKKTRIGAHRGATMNKRAISKTKIKQSGGKVRIEAVEYHDLYKKTALNQGKKDSYEDYFIPKKDEDALISVEEGKATSKTVRPKVSKPRQLSQTRLKKYKGGAEGGYTAGAQGTRMHPSAKPPALAAQESAKKPDEKNGLKNKLPRFKKKTTYVAPEYYDDTTPTASPQLKVRTENIGQGDYEDLSPESKAKLKAKEATAESKKVKIATNMQTRHKFSFSSPNYYAKLPRIAEKYNFDEPIPKKDQEAEKLKEIVNDPDVLINKKVQVNPPTTHPIKPKV